MKAATKYAVRKHGDRRAGLSGMIEKGVIAVPEHYVTGDGHHPVLSVYDLTGFNEEIRFLECRMAGITKAAALRLIDHTRREAPELQLTMTNGFGYHTQDGDWHVTALILRHADGARWQGA